MNVEPDGSWSREGFIPCEIALGNPRDSLRHPPRPPENPEIFAGVVSKWLLV